MKICHHFIDRYMVERKADLNLLSPLQKTMSSGGVRDDVSGSVSDHASKRSKTSAKTSATRAHVASSNSSTGALERRVVAFALILPSQLIRIK
jgi:hypothetical protein